MTPTGLFIDILTIYTILIYRHFEVNFELTFITIEIK